MEITTIILEDLARSSAGRTAIRDLLKDKERYLRDTRADVRALKRSGNKLEARTIASYEADIERDKAIIKTLKAALEKTADNLFLC